MLIYVCDSCRHSKEVKSIVGNEFAYSGVGFKTLRVTIDGKRDLCKSCFEKVEDAYDRVEETTSRWKRWRLSSALNRALNAGSVENVEN